MLKQKKAVSLMVSYVLLIVIGISLAILVYYWILPQINLEEMPKCPDNVALIIMDYSCDLSTDEITLTLKNQGRFDIDGFFIRGTDSANEEAIPATGLSDPDNAEIIDGSYYFGFPKISPLEPNGQETKTFSYFPVIETAPITELKRIQIEPFRIQNSSKTGKPRIALCDTATITQNVNCVAEAPPGDGGTLTRPVSWWKFDESTGATSASDSADGNVLVLSGYPSFSVGKVGNALSVNDVGVNGMYAKNYTQISNLQLTGDLSLEALINLNSLPTLTNAYIIREFDSTKINYGLRIDTSGKVIFYYTGISVITSSNPISIGTWYHIVAVKSGSTFILYINNVNVGSGTSLEVPIYQSDSLQIGRIENGLTDEVAIYDKALSEVEISAHYTNSSVGRTYY